MTKILFSDLDGTLIDHQGELIHSQDLNALSQLRQNGHLVALCTGRNNIDLIPTLNKIAIPYDYLVLCNGAYIQDAQGHVLKRSDIPLDVAASLLKAFRSYPPLVTYFCDEAHCVFRDSQGVHVLDESGVFKDSSMTFEKWMDAARCFTIIGVHQEDRQTDILDHAVQSILPAYQKAVSWSYNTAYVDIMAHGSSKQSGLVWLCQYLGIPLEDSYAIGDSFNDLGMLQAAGHGFTFQHAPSSLKEVAESIVAGVYEVAQKIHNA